MSEESLITKVIYTTDGISNEWPIPFSYTQDDDVAIYLADTDGVLTRVVADFVIDNATKKVFYPSFAAPIVSGLELTLIRETELTQENEFNGQAYFNPKEVEKSFDKQTRMIQDLDEKISRSVKFPLNTSPTLEQTEEYLSDLESIKSDAENAAQAASDFAIEASDSADLSLISADNALVSEQNTTFYANLFLFEAFIPVLDLDSPIGPVSNGALYLANDANGNIDFILPDITSVDDNWKIAVIKQTASLNVLNVIPFGTDTILLQPTFVATQQGIGVVFFKESPTNWGSRYFAFTESTGINPLPPGGAIGAALVKSSAADSDAIWLDLVYEGFSSRFNSTVSLAGLKNTLDYILAISYLGPLIASFTGSSNVLREKGESVASVTLSTNVTKRSSLISRIRFLQGATVVADNNPPVNTGSGVTTATYSTPFTDNITFTTEVTDTADGGSGPTTVSASASYNFVYPYYSGAAAPARTAAQVATLAKTIVVSTATLNKVFTAAGGDVYYYAYPASYGNLTSILDESGFEVFSAFTRRTENITGLDGNAVSYAIYVSNNPVVAGTTNFTFKR